MMVDIRPTVLTPEDDPHIWLEDIEGKNALEWVHRQNENTRKNFADDIFKMDRDALISIYNHPEKIPYIIRRGEHVYNFWKDRDHVRGVWRRTTLKDYASDSPDWDILINLDALAAEEGEDWTWKGATLLPQNNNLSIVYLSPGGSDASCLREFDLKTKSFVSDGFSLSQAKGRVSWLDKDTLLLCSAYGDGKATECGYSNTARLWERGVSAEQAKVIFEVDSKHMGAWVEIDRSLGEEHIIFYDRKGFFNEERWIGDRSGPKVKIAVPDDARIQVNKGWLAVRPQKEWTTGDNTYAADSLLGISFESFLHGDRDFSVLFTPHERKSLQDFHWCSHFLILSILDNLAPTFEFFSPDQNGWKSIPAPQFPNIGMASVSRLDEEKCEANGDMIYQFQSPVSPNCYKIISANGGADIIKESPELFDCTGLEISRHEAISTNGEKVPYLQIGTPGSRGDAPVLMNGYGGFNISMEPVYNAT
ncbi:MAG: prolyl oligopeptidase family serine peptidase, partial [Methyloligellaceae bacterium]